jgi:hypothetical protein
MIVGNATPKHARTMWKPNDNVICSRAGSRPGGTSVARVSTESLKRVIVPAYGIAGSGYRGQLAASQQRTQWRAASA